MKAPIKHAINHSQAVVIVKTGLKHLVLYKKEDMESVCHHLKASAELLEDGVGLSRAHG